MSTGILLFCLVAAALVTRGQLQGYFEDGFESKPFVREIKLNPGMQIRFAMNGKDPFHLDFLTDNCSIALRINFHPRGDNIIMNTLYAQGWGNEERTSHKFQDASAVRINVTDNCFSITMGNSSFGKVNESQKVAEYEYRFPLSNITHLLIYAGRFGEHYPTKFAVLVAENELLNVSGWLQPKMMVLEILEYPPKVPALVIIGKHTSNFTIELEAPNDTVALRMRFQNSSVIRDIRKAGEGWSREETQGPYGRRYKLYLGNKIGVKLKVLVNGYYAHVNGHWLCFSEHTIEPRLVNLVRVTGLAETLIVYATDPEPNPKPIPCKGDGAALKPFVLKTALKPGMGVFFAINGVDSFRFDFVTNNCSSAPRVNFQPDQNDITMGTLYAHGWDIEQRAPYRFKIYTAVWINVTDNCFSITMGNNRSQKVAEYEYHLPLSSITHVQLDGGQQNELLDMDVKIDDNQLQIMDDWLQASLIDIPVNTMIDITGILRTSSFIIELMAKNSVALRIRFQDSYVSLDCHKAGHAWSEATKIDRFELQPGYEIEVMLFVNKKDYLMEASGTKRSNRVNETVQTEGTFKHQVQPRLVDLVRVTGLIKTHIRYSTSPQPTTKASQCKAKNNDPK